MTRARTIPWDIYEEHLDEAAFLFGQWEKSLFAANYTIDEVASGPEERLRAHLDGLVLGKKPVAEKLLLPALAAEEPERAWAAAWALLHAEHGDHWKDVEQALTAGADPVKPAIARAFELSDRVDLTSRIAPLWDKGDPFLQRVVLDVLGWRHPMKARERLRAAFDSRDAGLTASALRALRCAPEVTYATDVAAAVDHPDPDVRAEAVATAHALGLGIRGGAARDAATGTTAPAWIAMALLALRDEAAVQLLVSKPETRRAATWALGFAGTVSAVDRLVALSEDEEIGPIAADSIAAMAGVVIGGPFARTRARQGVEVEEEVPLDAPPPEVRPEDDLTLPHAKNIAYWWHTARAQFAEGTAYLGGRPRNRDALRAHLARGTTWRRAPIALELAAIERGPVAIDVRAWTARQRVAAVG
ncbi:MAG: TIGR02270 family protein [Polyangiaceae bacterium]